ncbi:MAG: M48 family metalloprotease [Bdellovibrionota bacterium]
MNKCFLLVFSLILIGCGGIQSLGTSVLQATGMLPGTSVFDASESMVTAAKEMSREEEYYLGRAVAAKILEIYKPYNNQTVQDYIALVGASAAAFSDMPDTFGGYHFMVLDSDEINAMAAPGGFIFITRGMLEIMPDEDALAAVLAHEVSHVEKQHGLAAISQSNLSEVLAGLGAVAGSLNCGELLTQATAVFGGAVDDVFTSLIEKGYSRDQEFEADAGAVQILYRAGYNPHSILVMLDEVGKSEAGEAGGWFDTHPETSRRKQKVVAVLESDNIPASDTGRFARSKRFDQHVRQSAV